MVFPRSTAFLRSPDHAPLRREIRATLRLAIPLVLAQIGNIAISTTDVIMVGRLGPAALAAISLGSGLYVLFMFFGLGVVTAVAGLAAQAFGARQPRHVRRTVRQGLWIATIIALPSIAILAGAEGILRLLGQQPDLSLQASRYIHAAMWGLVPTLWLIALRGFVSAIGRPQPVMWVMIGGVFCNALANYVLIFGHWGFPALGLVGAGIASSLVNTLMFAALLLIAVRARPFRRYDILGRLWRADWPRFWLIARIGLPIGTTALMEIGLFIGATFLMGLFGTNQLAASQIALQCAAVTFMIPLGVAQAATVRVGQAYGRGDMGAIGRAGWVAGVLALLFMSTTAVVFWLAPRQIVGAFIDLSAPQNAAVIGYAVSFLYIAALFQIFDGAQVVALHALRGINDTRTPMIIAAIGYWGIGLGTAAFLATAVDLEGIGIWLGLLLGLVVVSIMLVTRFHNRVTALQTNGLAANA
ncbi:MAG: MATE family efflux transporter [Alphaproteobacteria bacterium]